MKAFTFPTKCDVCGGEGTTTGNPYIKGFRHHIDPRICAEILNQKKRKDVHLKK